MIDHLDILARAELVATEHHEGVYRKYHNPPVQYVTHPKRVARRAANMNGFTFEELIYGTAAGFTHDCLEDPNKYGVYLRYDELVAQITEKPGILVKELTNPSKDRPDLSRADRKKMDREHIATISVMGKCLKMIDRTDNLNSMEDAPEDFLEMYGKESELLYLAIGIIDHPAYPYLASEYILAIEKARRFIKT